MKNCTDDMEAQHNELLYYSSAAAPLQESQHVIKIWEDTTNT